MILAMPYGLVKQTAVDNLNLRGAASDGYFHYWQIYQLINYFDDWND